MIRMKWKARFLFIMVIMLAVAITLSLLDVSTILLKHDASLPITGETVDEEKTKIDLRTTKDNKIDMQGVYVKLKEDIALSQIDSENDEQVLEYFDRKNLKNVLVSEKTVPSTEEETAAKGPNMSASIGSWQNVYGTRSKFFVFSAYYEEEREERRLSVIATTVLVDSESVWCRMWTSAGSHLADVKANLLEMIEHKHKEFSGFFLYCPLEGIDLKPHSVSIVKELSMPCTNHLLVHDASRNNKYPIDDMSIALCVKPMHHNYDKVLLLIEFLEYYKLLGVSHMITYNLSIADTTSCVLSDYQRQGFATVLPWQHDLDLDDVGDEERQVRHQNMIAALNECLYRTTSSRFALTVMVDLDEFIVPAHNYYTLQDMIRNIDPNFKSCKYGSYQIRNAFFYMGWPDDVGDQATFGDTMGNTFGATVKEDTSRNDAVTATDTIRNHLITVRKTRRRKAIHDSFSRSKFICRPDLTREVGNHFVFEHEGSSAAMLVPTSSALLHHYRDDCEMDKPGCLRLTSVVDRTAHQYRQELAKQVEVTWNRLKHQCSLPDW
ncbi:uncharacterized protein LOC111056775 [Nilaparvata lugens]|uniref:uncharacterized protein LOC111056775 n=1 Tax=Nilaparvata lugens TaxID=108931 RepID=UPI00193D4861|nr:uncharacterized protein LOC111056775 [Nilaparvata lugens]